VDIFYRLEQTRCDAGSSVPQQLFCGFGPKTTTSDLWNKTRTHFAGTGSTQNPVEKKMVLYQISEAEVVFPPPFFLYYY
jgi:hypothetical protein